jgi:hypothetical protein
MEQAVERYEIPHVALVAVAGGGETVSRQLEATTERVVAADEATARAALESHRWERRGLLGRLTRRAR